MVAAAAPELAGMNPAQVQGALQMMQQTNPQRAQQIAQLVGQAQNLVAQHQQQQFAEQQRQQAAAAEQFRQFAQASDNRFDAMNKDMPKEQMTAIKQEAVSMLKEYGLSDQDLMREYNSNPLFRSAAGQQIIAEAARWRLAQRSVSRAATRPVPNVQRPGISEPVRIDDGAVSEALARLNAPGGNEGRIGLKNAAALVAARRGSR
jgi:hypothetical protein